MKKRQAKTVRAQARPSISASYLAAGIAELSSRLENLEEVVTRDHGYKVAPRDLGLKATTVGPSTLNPTMGYVDRFVGNTERLREARRHLESFMSRLGILDQPPEPATPTPQSHHMRDMLEEYNTETHRIGTLISDLAQSF